MSNCFPFIEWIRKSSLVSVSCTYDAPLRLVTQLQRNLRTRIPNSSPIDDGAYCCATNIPYYTATGSNQYNI